MIAKLAITEDRVTRLRLLASCVYFVMEGSVVDGASPMNPLNGAEKMQPFRLKTGDHIDDAESKKIVESAPLTGYDAPDAVINYADVAALPSASIDEWAAYFGILTQAGVKRATAANLSAFNERRVQSIKAFIGSSYTFVIFVPSSTYLTERVLGNMYASFNAEVLLRRAYIRWLMSYSSSDMTGCRRIFMTIFSLLERYGLGSLYMITDMLAAFPETLTVTDHLLAEWRAWYRGWIEIHAIPSNERMFAKVIWGNDFIPVDQASIKRLFFIARELLKTEVASYANFAGGVGSPEDVAIVARIREARGIDTTTVQGPANAGPAAPGT